VGIRPSLSDQVSVMTGGSLLMKKADAAGESLNISVHKNTYAD